MGRGGSLTRGVATRPAAVRPGPSESSAMVDRNGLERKTFRAHGAAAEIWIVESLTEPVTKCISKVIRLDEEGLQRYHNPKSKPSANELWKGFLQDVQSRVNEWLPIHHKNVVQIFGLHEGLDLRVEYCSNGTASQFLNKNASNQIVCRRNMILDVVKGVAHLHSQNPPIVHGSLNMNKLFVDDAGTTKIGEFGLSALTSHFALYLPFISQVEVSRWMSPELVDLDTEDAMAKPTTASDIWALGCTLFEILSGKLPYPECKHELRVYTKIADGELPGRKDHCLSSELEDIWPSLAICWSSTPDSRPTAQDLEERLSPEIPHSQSLKDGNMETGSEAIPKLENPQTQPLAIPTKVPSGAVQRQFNSKVFALVIGINAYLYLWPKIQNLAGAIADADTVARFLIDDLNVPPDQITNLRDESATREAIIKAIEDLSENARIEKGNPILIYFAGHGGQAEASARWKAKSGADKIQVICPYDQGMVKSNKTVYPIPDRTIRALVNKLSLAKGDNITLIFDSCHSASANRQRSDGPSTPVKIYRARGVEITVEIPDDLDNELITNDEAGHQDDGGARGIMPMYRDQASHVFLAACGSKDFAWEEGGRGLFTTALLETIQANDVDNITYENLLAALPQLPHDQSPHCSGTHKSRILFNSCIPTRRIRFRAVERDKGGNWILQAGASSGVLLDSVWELYEAPTEKSVSLGTLRACSPKTASTQLKANDSKSLAAVPEGTTRLYACQVQAGADHEMKVYFTPEAKALVSPATNNAAPSVDEATREGGFWSQLWGRLRPSPIASAQNQCPIPPKTSTDDPVTNEFRYVTTDKQDDADMVVGVYRKPESDPEITFIPCESSKESYDPPLLTKRAAANREEVDAVLAKAAGWNQNLKYKNPSEPSDRTISLQFLKLRESSDVPIKEPLKDLNENGLIRIQVKPGDESEYGIKLVNHIDRPLHVRVLYFDVPNFSLLEVGSHVAASGRKDPEIAAKGHCLFGDTADGGQSMTFGIAEPGRSELGFIKVIWCTAPFEVDNGKGGARGLILTTKEAPDVWGSLVVKLVLHP